MLIQIKRLRQKALLTSHFADSLPIASPPYQLYAHWANFHCNNEAHIIAKVLELSVEGKRYVIAGGEYRQKRDFARRTARLEKAERELQRLAAVRRKKPNPQKLASPQAPTAKGP